MITLAKKEDHLLTIAEVAKRLRVDTATVRRWISLGTLEAVSLPQVHKRHSYRIKESTIATLLGE
ncbi:MAG: helix-turn-helix domain-containing protein [Ktedonobacteraceae bacterium]